MTSIANYNYNKMNAFGRQRNVSANVAALNVINFNSNKLNQIPTPKSLHVQLKKLTSAPKNLRKAGFMKSYLKRVMLNQVLVGV